MPKNKKDDEYFGKMVPDPKRTVEHGQQPTKYVPPPALPKPVGNSGIGNIKKK